MSKNRQLIEEDLKVMDSKTNVSAPMVSSLIIHLYRNRFYRNIFYRRIGAWSKICAWLLPRSKTFYPFAEIGGGVYAAHPYATILNAQSIGRNFSFRQCTTVGNKRDGDGSKGPTIGDNVSLGANVCVIGDIHIGNNVIVGAGAVVVKDVPDNVVVAGNPAKIIRYL